MRLLTKKRAVFLSVVLLFISAFFMSFDAFATTKLDAPTNITWNNNTVSWDVTPNATGYTVVIFNPSGETTGWTLKDTNSHTIIPNPDDGTFVRVIATADGYRDSDYGESALKGGVSRAITPRTTNGNLHMTLSNEGVLSWDAVTGATSYDLTISYNDEVVYSEGGNTETSFEFVHNLDEWRWESGVYQVAVHPADTEGFDDMQAFTYVSRWNRLDAPTNLRWDGDLARWNGTDGAAVYIATLYDSAGHVMWICDTTDLVCDFSEYAPQVGSYFTVVASNIEVPGVARDSGVNESPAKEPIAIDTVNISVVEPEVGATPDFSPRVEDGSNYHIDYAEPSNAPSWFLYGNGEYPPLNPSSTFEYEKTYGFTLYIVADEGYALTSDTTYMINEHAASKVGGTLPSNAFVKCDFTMPSEPEPVVTHTVSFDSHGGSGVGTQTVDDGETAFRPSDPVWNGHVFLGWYSDLEDDDEYNFSISVNQDLTLHAKWAIAISSASATVTEPMGTKYPDFNPVAGGDTYTVSVHYWYLYEEPYDNYLSTGSHFEDGKEYALRLAFEPNEGYAFTNDAVFTINGMSTDSYGRINDREVRFMAGTPTYIHSASATVTTPIYGAHPDFNPTTDEAGYNVELEGWRLYDSSLDYPLLNEESTFEADETYELGYYLVADDTHAFANDATFTLNGETVYSVGGDGLTYIFIRDWFDIPIYNITTSVYDLTSQRLNVGGQTEIYTDKDGWSGLSYSELQREAVSSTYAYVGAEPDADYEFVEWRIGSVDGERFSPDRLKWFVPTSNIQLFAILRRIPVSVSYTTHVQSYGWQNYVSNGMMAGTSGESKRLEAIKIKLEHADYSGGIEYRTHIQTYGWENEFKSDDQMSGTSGEAKRLEAIEIRLTGEMAEHYDVWYRVHAQSFGWLGWAKNGEKAGTEGYAKRLEGIEIFLIEKDEPPFSDVGNIEPFKEKKILYTTHVQTYGWQDYAYDGNMAGTSGESKRLEAIKIKLNNQKYDGDVEYRTHIQTYGWEEDFKKNDEMSGTSGEAKRLEAIEIRLTDEMAEHYDIYYRVHAQSFGWLNWAKNGERAGTAGFAKRLEGIEIVLVDKGSPAPERTDQNDSRAYIEQ